ncbi:unnamed protein product [Calypogeia fissa]
MMLTGLRIPTQRALPPSCSTGVSSHQSRILLFNCKRSPSLSIRGSATESGGGIGNGDGNAARDPTKDTRIHWGSSDEGWVGGNPQSTPPPSAYVSSKEEVLSRWRTGRSDTLLGILVQASDSHYRYLELTPEAETEEIKAAYRRLSKTYHPDTTSLPLEVAAEKFVRLKEAYTVLSSEEQRRLYDWQLAQKLLPQKGSWTTLPSEYGKTMADDGTRLAEAWKSDMDFIDNPVDTLGGRNMDLSGQAQTALVFDAFAIIVSIVCICIAIFLKQS